MKLIQNDNAIFLDNRRMNIYGMNIEWKCPNCGEIVSTELDNYYFEGVQANEDRSFSLGCPNCLECYTFKGKLNISFEITDSTLEVY